MNSGKTNTRRQLLGGAAGGLEISYGHNLGETADLIEADGGDTENT